MSTPLPPHVRSALKPGPQPARPASGEPDDLGGHTAPPRRSGAGGRAVLWPGLATLIGLCAVILAPAPDVAAVRLAIRVTAATSLVCFLMAFTAQAAWLIAPGRLTAAWRRHRRQWGLLFVASHTLHLAWVCWLRDMAPGLWSTLVPTMTLITGGVAYVWLWTMGLTSTDRAVEVLGRARWQALHRWGSFYLWLSFLVAYGKRVPLGAGYAVPTALLVAALMLRWYARRRTATP